MDEELIDIQPMNEGQSGFIVAIKLWELVHWFQRVFNSCVNADTEQNEVQLIIERELRRPLNIGSDVEIFRDGKWNSAKVIALRRSFWDEDEVIITVQYDNKGIKWYWNGKQHGLLDEDVLSLTKDKDKIKIKPEIERIEITVEPERRNVSVIEDYHDEDDEEPPPDLSQFGGVAINTTVSSQY